MNVLFPYGSCSANDWDIIRSLGVAQYRCGQYRAALATLARSRALHLQESRNDLTSDLGQLLISPWLLPATHLHANEDAISLAFLAMSRCQLGQKAESKATFARLRAVMSDPKWAKNAEAQGFLHEAESLIQD